MRVEKYLVKRKRRFEALCRCEFCREVVYQRGYDHEIFQTVQIPEMKCPACGRARVEEGETDEQ